MFVCTARTVLSGRKKVEEKKEDLQLRRRRWWRIEYEEKEKY